MSTCNGPRTPNTGERPAYRNDLIHRPKDLGGLWWLLFVCLTVVMLCLPFMHYVDSLGDEGVLLHGAERFLQGQTLYIDFFAILPPGGFVIMAAWFSIAGVSISSARLLAILTVTGIACFTYLACREASKHRLSSALVVVGWAVMSTGLLTQINHHWFSTLLCMVAAWAALASVDRFQRSQWGSLIAGVAAGAAAMVTPAQGALSMLAAATSFLGSHRLRTKLVVYVLGSVLIPLCLLAYVIAQGALAAAFDEVILFTAERYASIQSVPFGYRASDLNRPLVYLFPIVALLTLITCAHDWRGAFHDGLFRVCVAFGLAGFIAIFPRPDIVHIAFVTPLVCPLLTYCTHRIVASWLPKYRYTLAVLVLVLGILPVFAFSFAAYTVLHKEFVATPRGRVKFWHSGMRQVTERIAATPPSDHYFFYPYIPMLPFLTARQHVSKYEIFVPAYTTPSQYQEACISAFRRASWVVINRNWDVNYLREVFPAIRNAEPPEKNKLEEALKSGFEFVARDGAYELRRRVKTVDESVCANTAE